MKTRSTLTSLLCCAILAAALAVASGTAVAAVSKKKIVALTPFSANTLVDVGKKPVAIGAMAIGKKGMSPKLKKLKQLPLSHPNGPNMEQIAQIDPDIVLSASGWAKGTQTMRDLAITVRYMDPATAGQVVPKIRAIGAAYGSKKLTDKLVKQTKGEIACANGTGTCPKDKKKHPIPAEKKKVMVVLGVGRTPYVFLANSWGGSIVKAAGGTLLDGGKKDSGGFAKVADEFVVAENPDVIIAVPHGNSKDLQGIADYMKDNPAWSTTNAVKNNQVHVAMDDALLQPNVDVGDTIKRVRKDFIQNW